MADTRTCAREEEIYHALRNANIISEMHESEY